MDPQQFDRCCFVVSKFMTSTLRHGSSILPEEDGAVRFDGLINHLEEEFGFALQWTVKVRSNNDQFSCDIRNLKSAQSQFLSVTESKRMIDQMGGPVEERIAEERESSSAQIRTLFNEQRKTIIAECSEKVSHPRTPRSSSTTRTQSSTGRIIATNNRIFVKFINKILQR